jgi:hypothetical protein
VSNHCNLHGRCLYIVHFADAPIFAGGILGLEGISTPSVWPAASTFTCLPPTPVTRILLRLASLRPFAGQFGIGFVIAWYIISSLSPLNPQPLWRFVFRRPCSTPAHPPAQGANRFAPPRPQRGDASTLPMTFVFYCEGIGWLPFAAPPRSTF